ncbi:MAG: DUF1653 domain-containing protein [Gammaproteobacteria bacterium]|nr:DUF1653 domain-containing protein [Gammaproteobacteria bacterium]MDD9895395.1 DUF1653 domain-containing protein [Gammaproteobacteria bacterium]MDD9957588.1 DUF1653 domain-containing protein [Gammaproteobacteria bacterium]
MNREKYADIPRGKYRHYKNKEYELIDIVHHSETQEPLVLYRALYGDFGLWVRPLDMFFETIEIDGKLVNRFQHIDDINL